MSYVRYGFASAAWLDVQADGRAFAKLDDGRRAAVFPTEAGWAFSLAGAPVNGFSSSEDAISDLTLVLANQRVMLRRR